MAPKVHLAEPCPKTDDLDLDLEPVTTEVQERKRSPMKIVWLNVTIFSLLHLSALYALTLLPWAHPLTWLWGVFMYMVSAIGITAGAHRLWTHRSYKAKLPLRILLAIMNSSASQNDIIEWARDHRVHHKYSETDADPHNATRGFFFAHIGWLLVRKHPDVTLKGKQFSLADLYDDPVLRIQRKFYKLSVVVFCFLLPTFIPHFLWGETLWNAFLIAAILRYTLTLNATWLVNSAAHMWGMKPYDKTINPAENKTVAFGAVGEGFHNYHHTFPNDYGTSEYGWHINMTTLFIDFMAFLGQAYDRKKISPDVVRKRRERTGDLSK